MNFLHYFHPNPILFQVAFVTVRWYGFFMALALVLGVLLVIQLGKAYHLKSDDVVDLAVWLFIGGVIGARLYEVIFINWGYYQNNLWAIFKIWQGGIAIHGAILGGGLALWLWVRKRKTFFLILSDLLVVALILGQAIGRWGNYFNQELYGRPTDLPWGIPIDAINRPNTFFASEFFQPAFLYESILNLALLAIIFWLVKKKILTGLPTAVYLIGYGIIRFIMEWVRIDATPELAGLRLPQIASIILILAGAGLLIGIKKRHSGAV